MMKNVSTMWNSVEIEISSLEYLLYAYNQVAIISQKDDSTFRETKYSFSFQLDDHASKWENFTLHKDEKLFDRKSRDYSAEMYFGGFPQRMSHHLNKLIKSKSGIQGCIASLDVIIEKRSFDLGDLELTIPPEFQKEVLEECIDTTSNCNEIGCANGGTCQEDWDGFSCDCLTTSFTGIFCRDDAIAYRFGHKGGSIRFNYGESERADSIQDSLTFGLVTNQSDVVLMRIGSGNSNDFIEIEIKNGNLIGIYNMGTADHPVGELFERVDDGRYHIVRFTRHGPNATIQIDQFPIQSKHPTGRQLSSFNNQAFLDIGGRKDGLDKNSRPFNGIISGLVLNGQPIFAYVMDADSRILMKGDVQLESRPLQPYMSSKFYQNQFKGIITGQLKYTTLSGTSTFFTAKNTSLYRSTQSELQAIEAFTPQLPTVPCPFNKPGPCPVIFPQTEKTPLYRTRSPKEAQPYQQLSTTTASTTTTTTATRPNYNSDDSSSRTTTFKTSTVVNSVAFWAVVTGGSTALFFLFVCICCVRRLRGGNRGSYRTDICDSAFGGSGVVECAGISGAPTVKNGKKRAKGRGAKHLGREWYV